MTLVGYGMPFYHNGNTFGNMFITFNIDWPETITQEQSNGIKNIFKRAQNTTQEAQTEDDIGLLEPFSEDQINSYEEGGQAPPFSQNTDNQSSGPSPQ